MKLRTHEKAWRVENKIYALQNIRLPVPLALSAIGYFLLTCAIVFLISKALPFMTPIISKYSIVSYGALPYFVTNFMRKKKLDGKPPHVFFIQYIKYLFERNNNLEFFRVPERQSKDVIKLNWHCTHRNT